MGREHGASEVLHWDGPCVEDDYSEESWPDPLGPHAHCFLTRHQRMHPHECFQLWMRYEVYTTTMVPGSRRNSKGDLL